MLFIEVGPGKVLCGLLKQIDPALKSLNVEDAASLEKTLAELRARPNSAYATVPRCDGSERLKSTSMWIRRPPACRLCVAGANSYCSTASAALASRPYPADLDKAYILRRAVDIHDKSEDDDKA